MKRIILLSLTLLFGVFIKVYGSNNLIKNSSFTDGFTSWTASGDWHHGTFTGYYTAPDYAWFATASGQQGDNLSGTISQNITMPSCGSSFYFRFYYKITSDETTTTLQNDKLTAQAVSSNGTIIGQIVLSNLNKVISSGGYIQSGNITIPSTYSGQTVTIKFIGSTNASLGSTFRVDDVEVIPSLSPDLTIILGSINPTSISAGSFFSAYCAENNIGSGYAGPNVISFHLSVNTTFEPGTDPYLDQIVVPTGICGLSQSNIFSKNITIPASTVPGQYYIFMSADGALEDYESNDANNQIYVPITITAACSISAGAPNTIYPGNTSSTNPPSVATDYLQWNSLSGATTYNLYIRDVTTNILYNYNCGSSGTTYVLPASMLFTGHTYKWNMSGSSGCGSSCISLVSQDRYFIYTPCTAVSVTAAQPATQTLCTGISASFTVTASGTGPYTYQWKKGTTNLTNGTKYENATITTSATTATLKINTINSADAGSYSCFVTGCNSTTATSTSGQLIVSTGTAPNADFNATNNYNNIYVNQSVIFAPINTCTGCTYLWSFQNGSPATSTQQNPIVTYNYSSTNNVSLTVTNSCGLSTTKSISGFITVKPTNNQNTQIVPPNIIVNMNGYHIAFAADPIKIPTLDYGYNTTVLSMNTIGGMIDFKVFYNSNNTSYSSNLGTGWSHNFDNKVVNEGDTVWRVYYGEGYNVPFIKLYNGGGNSFPQYAGVFEKLYKDPTTNTYTLTFKNGTVYYFDALGKFDYFKDRYNNTTDLDYDGNGYLTKITGAGGRYWTITNNTSTGKIIKIQDQANREVSFNYSGTDITGIINPDTGVTSFQYDGAHLMTQVTNPEGNVLLQNVYTNGKVTTQYDVFGKATNFYANTPSVNYTKVVFPDGAYKIYQSDDYFRIVDEQDEEGNHIKHGYYADNTDSLLIDKNGNQTTFEKDSIGNITTIYKPSAITEEIQYDKFSLPISVKDGEGYITKHTRDVTGNEIETVFADSTKISRIFSSNGQLISQQNELNSLTYAYTSQGDIATIQTPTGTVQTFTNAIGWDTASVNQIGQRASKVYNGRGLEIKYTDIDGKSVQTTYDKNDNKISVVDKKNYKTNFYYDLKDRPIATVNIYGDTLERSYYDDRDFIIAEKSANGGITNYVNDKIGQVKQITNPLGGVTTITRDNNGNIISSTDAVTNITTVNSYDALNRNYATTTGNLSTSKTFLKNSWIGSVTNPRGLTTKFLFTPLGKIKDIEDANAVHTIVSYNKLQSPENVTDPNGHITTTLYDTANRPFQYKDALGNTETKTLDNISRITMITKANGVTITTSAFTAANLPQTVQYSTGENLSYTYDDNENLSTASGQLGISSFEYDSLNFTKKYTDPFGNQINYRHDASGNLLSIQYQTGKEINYTYNALNQITDVVDWRSGIYHYEYNNAGQLLKTTYPNKMYCAYGYDNNGLVISKIWKKDNGTILYADTVTRSSWGDIKAIACGDCYPKLQKSTIYGASYNQADQIIEDSVAKHYFDNSGNDTLIKAVSNSIHINYTANNIIKSFTSDSSAVTYGYDAFFNRIKRTSNGIEKRFVINAGIGLVNVLMEQNSSGQTTAWNIYGAGLLSRVDSSGKMYYYITDIKHNVVALADDSANTTDRYIYDVLGKLAKHTGTKNQPYTWLGEYGVQQENDSVYFVRARYYDAVRGRFFNTDPYEYNINNPQTINRYVYALNDAVDVMDYTGLYGGKDESISAPSNNWLYQVTSALYNFGKGTASGVWEGLSLSVYKPGNIEQVEDTYTPSYATGYKVGGILGSLFSFASLLTGEGEASIAANSTKSLFHYTNEAGYKAIMESGELLPSIGSKNARFGPGQYLTDIAPGQLTIGQTSRQIFGIPWNTSRLTHYIELDVSGINVLNNSSYNYLIPGTESFQIEGRVINSGVSIFK